MQESWELTIPEKLESRDNGPDSAAIMRLLEQNQTAMGIFLSYYYRKEGGLVEDVKTNHIGFTSPISGVLSLSYKVVYFNACLDIHSNETESMPIHFTLNLAQNKLELTGPRWPEREPDEI